jgi:predicted heme/steroid binding protein
LARPGAATAPSPPGLRAYTRADLARCGGADPSLPVLIAYGGKVYDVTASYPWALGRHWGDHCAGADHTGAMDPRIHGPEMLDRVPCVGVLTD